jgi:hypothetical protein
VALSQCYLQVVWEGLASQQWNPVEMKTLDDQLRSFDLLADCRIGLEGEQASFSAWVEQTPPADLAGPLADSFSNRGGAGPARLLLRGLAEWSIRSCPRGWLHQQLLDCTRVTQAHLALCDVQGQRVYPEKEALLLALTRTKPWYLAPGGVLSQALTPNFVRVVPGAARAQSAVNLARVACSLEAYRLQHGGFPEKLTDLPPGVLAQTPHDLVNGRPLRYHLTEGGRFLLYSVGWDGQDDLGQVASAAFEQGTDWVWCYPR